MKSNLMRVFTLCLLLFILISHGCTKSVKEIQRPEKIVSKRQIVYDEETYTKLEGLWKEYYKAFPSEDAYANWMYAARYAENPDYLKLLSKGVKKYGANPTLLYLYGIRKHAGREDKEELAYLEKATRLDPTYMDPWFSLMGNYYGVNPDKEKSAMRHLLEGGAIPEEVMDYNYNVLVSLEKNAILVTNGDMDTYPCWILQRLLNFRPDVIVANISLLNTDWYPFQLMEEGLPRFITESELKQLKVKIMAELKQKKQEPSVHGPFGDTLLTLIIEAAQKDRKPVYFAGTLYGSPVTNSYLQTGRNLGLATLVTTTERLYPQQIQNLAATWVNQFRTGGLDSWMLHYSKEGVIGRRLANNYAASIFQLLEPIKQYAPDRRVELFRWYQEHYEGMLSEKTAAEVNRKWLIAADIKEIADWLKEQGLHP